jgi:hypothetical protein
MRALVFIFACLLASFPYCHCSQAQGEHPKRPTEIQDAAFDAVRQKAAQFMKSGNYAEAIQCFKKAEIMAHSPVYAEDSPIMAAVAKRPLDPDGHLALGIYFMHNLDGRFNIHNPITKAQWTPQADNEFLVAIELSPDHRNTEAENDLKTLAELKAQAPAIPSEWKKRWDERFNFYTELLTQRWNPPDHKGCLIARGDVDVETGTVFLIVPSASKEFDHSVLKVMTDCFEEFPFLSWSPISTNYAFMSKDNSKVVESNPRSIIKGSWRSYLNEPLGNAKGIADDFIAKYTAPQSLARYCKPDTLCAFKLTPRQPIAHRMIFGVLKESPVPGKKATWQCEVVDGIPKLYKVWIGDIYGTGWTIEFLPDQPPPIDRFDNFLDMQRVRDALFSCIVAWQIDNTEQGVDEWFPRQPDVNNLQEKFETDDHHNVIAYKCKLKDGRIVRAALNEDLSISGISVDGKTDKLWQDAYVESPSNVEKTKNRSSY